MKSSTIFVLTLLSITLASTSPVFAGWDEGVAAFKAQKFSRAIAEFTSITDEQPKAWKAHYMLGLSYGASGQTADAVEHLRKAYDLNPNDLSLKATAKKATELAEGDLTEFSVEQATKFLGKK